MESALQRGHEDHIAAEGVNSMNHYNLVHKFIPIQTAMKIPDARAAVEKKGQGGQEQERGYSRSKEKQEQSPLCISDGFMSSQKRRIGT